MYIKHPWRPPEYFEENILVMFTDLGAAVIVIVIVCDKVCQ